MQVVWSDQLPAVLGDDAFGKAVDTPASTADPPRRLVKLNIDSRALQHLGALESGKSRADHEDPWLIAERVAIHMVRS